MSIDSSASTGVLTLVFSQWRTPAHLSESARINRALCIPVQCLGRQSPTGGVSPLDPLGQRRGSRRCCLPYCAVSSTEGAAECEISMGICMIVVKVADGNHQAPYSSVGRRIVLYEC